MRTFKFFIASYLYALGIFGQQIDLKAQTPPSYNCPGVTVSFTSSASYAPLTSSGVGTPRICMPQCISTTNCLATSGTTITPNFSITNGATISGVSWSVVGDIAISSTSGNNVTIISNVSNTSPFQYGKGRLMLSYSTSSGACGCKAFATIDVFKKANPLPTTQIAGPACVAIGELVAYSIAPDFSRNVNLGIGIDNNYRWTAPTGFSTPGYLSGDNSSRTWTVGPTFLSGNVVVSPGSSIADGANGVLGTGCNNLNSAPLAVSRKAGIFTLSVSALGADYSGLTGNATIAPSICLNAGSTGVASQCTLSVTSPEQGVTYTATSSGISFVPLTGGTSWRLEPTGTAIGTVNITGTVSGSTCGNTSATFTLRRGLTASNTLTCTDCPPANAGVICLLQNTQYTFQLNGTVPPGSVSNSNISISPTGLTSNANFNPTSNQLTFTTNSTGGANLYNLGLSNVTCAGGSINFSNQLRVAPNSNYAFSISRVIPSPATNNCGQFRMLAPNFPAAGCVQTNYTYTWTHSAGPAAIVGTSTLCGLFTVAVNAPGTLTCTIVQNTNGLCSGPCTVNCENFTPQTRTYTVTAADLSCILPPGAGNGNSTYSSLESSLDGRFELTPNPVDEVLNLKFENEDPERLILIRDLTGKVILMESSRYTSVKIQTKVLVPGTYLCTIKSGSNIQTKKFIKI